MNSKDNISTEFLKEGGKMGELIRTFDWSKTSIGSPESWPQSLRIAVRIMLECPFGMCIAWGDEYIQLYNDGYRPILGSTKHPQALGNSTRKTFTEIWPTIGPMFDGAMEGIPVGYPDFVLHLDRNGLLEECTFDFSYSPIRLENGNVGGVLVTCFETTEKAKATRTLKASEQDLQYAIDATELGTWELNPITNKFRGNNRLKEWFGLKPEDEIDLNEAIALISEKDKDNVIAAIKTALQQSSGGHYDIVYTIIHPQTNVERIVRAKGRASFDSNGFAYRFYGTLQDVTKETIASRMVAENERLLGIERKVLYNSFINSPASIAILKGESGIFEFVNIEFEKLIGKKIINGNTIIENFPEIELLDDFHLFKNVFATGEPFTAKEYPLQIKTVANKELKQFYLNIDIQPIKDTSEITERVLIHIIDVTDQVNSKNQIRASEAKFRNLVIDAPMPMVKFHGSNFIVKLVNKTALEISGKSYHEVINKPILELFPTLDKNFKSIFNQVYTEGETIISNETPIFLKSNGIIKTAYFNLVFQPLRDLNSMIYGIIVLGADVTEIINARNTIGISEKRFRMLTESIPHMIWIAGPDGNKIYFNQYYIDYTGLSFDELLDDGIRKIIHPEDLQKDIKLWQHSLNTGEDFSIEKRIRRHDGTYRWHISRAIARKDNHGSITEWIGSSTEIEDQKKVAEVYAKSEEQFRSFANSIQNLAWIADGEGSVYWYNQRWYDYTGYTFEEMKGWGWLKVHQPEHIEKITATVKALWKIPEAFDLIFQLRRFDGEFRWFLTRAYPVLDTDGNIERWIGTNTDITEQKNFSEQLEIMVNARTEQLRLQNQTFELAENISDFGSYKWNLTTNELEYSDNLFRLLDCEPQEFVPTYEKFLSFIHPEDIQQVLEDGNKTRDNKVLVEKPYRIISKNKKIKYFRSSGKVIGEGENNLLIGTVQDITKDVLASIELKEKNLELENANTELASFNYVASHDLQEPLRKIQAFSKRIVDKDVEALSDNSKDYFNRINAAAQRMQHLIESLLSFSRINLSETVFESTDLNQVLNEVKIVLNELIIKKNVVIKSQNLPTLNAIPVQMHQLFLNILSNSIKYSKADVPLLIEITAEKSNLSKSEIKDKKVEGFWKISIRDNGIGFEQQYENKIFELFQRLHGKSQYEGTGIGLAICKKIVQTHNGTISAKGEPGIGATFTFYLSDTRKLG